MRSYRVEVTAAAEKELARIPQRLAQRISAVIDKLAIDPRPFGSKKLAGTIQTYRVRVRDYRVVYDVDEKRVTVWIIRIRHRRDAYK